MEMATVGVIHGENRTNLKNPLPLKFFRSGSTRTLLYMYYQLGFEEFKMGQATSVAVIMIVITVLLSLIQFVASKRWVHY